MGAFNYQALDANGKTVKGVIEGDSDKQVRALLRQRQLRPLEVQAAQQRVPIGTNAKPKRFGFSGVPKLGYKDIALVTRQLASLIQSGLPLDEVLQATATQSKKPAVKSLMLQVRARVMEGLSLAQAMSEAPKAFNNLYRAMVRAGESAGFLGPVLDQLADYTERSQEARQKIQMAMIYPIVLMFVCFGVVTGLMAFVVPKLIGLFKNSKKDLPFITDILIATSNFVVNYGVFLVIGIIGLIVLFKHLLKEPSRELRWHKFLLKWPLIGELIRTSEAARYSSTLGLLVKSGVPLLEGLRIASQVLGNRHIQKASLAVAVSVQEGMSFNKALDQCGEFPPLLVQMVASGEANGQLAEQLLHVAANQERELSFTLGTLMGLMEPAMILIMAGIVGFVVMAIMLPIFQLNQMVH
jgi:general secretion pathway protein F